MSQVKRNEDRGLVNRRSSERKNLVKRKVHGFLSSRKPWPTAKKRLYDPKMPEVLEVLEQTSQTWLEPEGTLSAGPNTTQFFEIK